MPFTSDTLPYAIVGGILPAFVWLWFWLKEDARKPEPKPLILLTFIAGMLMVLLALPIEKWIVAQLPDINSTRDVILLAAVEEILKFTAAFLVAIRTRFFDEPIDAMIYLITVALGFAAMENMLYVWGAYDHGTVYQAILSADIRFIGATLLHVVASASIGFAIGYAYYKSRAKKFNYVIAGLLTAIALHTIFNLSIIHIQENTSLSAQSAGGSLFGVFAWFWALAIVIILLFEVLKKVNRPLKQPYVQK